MKTPTQPAAFRPGGRGPARTVAWLILLGLLSPGINVPAQTNHLSNSRYLLIFDTSAGMKRRSENVQRAAGDLLYSGMNGQMHPGDTIGVWTFNESLEAGKLPLMSWAPAQRTKLAGRVAEFIRSHKFEKDSRIEAVLPAVIRLVTDSPKLTVVVFSDGNSPWRGTPFDAGINAAYEPFRETQRRERMPFVTVLRSVAGEFIGYGVTPAPWAVEFPRFPPEPVTEASLQESRSADVKPPPLPPPTVQPLIVIGKRDTNAPPAVPLPQPGTDPNPQTKPGLTEAEQRFAKLAAEQGIDLPPGFGAPASVPPTVSRATPPEAPPIPATTGPAPVPMEKVVTKSAELPPPTATATNIPASTTASPVNPARPLVNPGPTNSGEIQAAALPLTPRASPAWLIAGAASLLVCALGVIYAVRRRRHRAHISLITRSMNRRDG